MDAVNTIAGAMHADHLPVGFRLHGGAYSIGKVLGRGGCGITYHGADVRLQREVAIKEFFAPGYRRSGNTVVETSSADHMLARENFLAEARVLARFNHPGIVDVMTVFEENNTAYMVMEFLEGQNLEQRVVKQGVLPEQTALKLVAQIVEALTVVHRAHFIHRDLKPSNAILCDDGRVVLIDFGLTKKVEAARNYQTRQFTAAPPSGTEGYAPPEQYLKDVIPSAASDIYALGATLYFLLTGNVPIASPERAMGATLPPPNAVNPQIEKRVSDAIMQAMQLESGARPRSAEEFLQILRVNTVPPVAPQKFVPGKTVPQSVTVSPAPKRQRPVSTPSRSSAPATPSAWLPSQSPLNKAPMTDAEKLAALKSSIQLSITLFFCLIVVIAALWWWAFNT
jgi:serine/threonine protein kinase